MKMLGLYHSPPAGSGRRRIIATAGFGRHHVAPLVPRFRELHSEVTISLNLSDRVVDLAGEAVDCAVRVGDLPDSSLVSVRLADNRRLCVATPGYLQRCGCGFGSTFSNTTMPRRATGKGPEAGAATGAAGRPLKIAPCKLSNNSCSMRWHKHWRR